MTVNEVIIRLKEGNLRFVNDELNNDNQHGERRLALADGQSPFAIVLSCADSRVIPELAFDAGLGELFVIRVAGNIPNIASIASIEYAVAVLKAKVIIVLGHESCGAVGAAIEGGSKGKNLDYLLAYISPAIDGAGANASFEAVVKINAVLGAKVLEEKSEIIQNAVNAEDLKIIPAYYHLDSGRIEFME